jgi:hypothetical protein
MDGTRTLGVERDQFTPHQISVAFALPGALKEAQSYSSHNVPETAATSNSTHAHNVSKAIIMLCV